LAALNYAGKHLSDEEVRAISWLDFDNHEEADFRGNLIILEPGRMRIRRG
jgi:hypothetical protein